MANVMLIEGWGLAGTGTDYADLSTNRKLAVLGWGYTGFDGSATVIQIASVGGGAGYELTMDDGTGLLYRTAPGATQGRLCLGFQIGGDSSSVGGGVGLAVSGGNFSGENELPSDAVLIGVSRYLNGFRIFENGSVSFISGDTGFIPAIDNWIELVVDFNTSTLELWVNNALVATQNLTETYPETRYVAAAVGNIRSSSSSISGPFSVGALYVADERLGRCQVITQRPSTDSAVGFARPQGDSNASQVTDPNGYDGDTTYVSSSTSGAEDLYGTDDPTGLTNERIHGVSVAVVGRKEDIGNRSITPVCAQGTTVAAGDPVTLEIGQYQGTQSVFSADPDTGLDWSLSGFNSSTFGVRLAD